MSTISWVRGASRMGRPSSGGPLQLLKTKGTVCILHVYTWWRLAWARHEYSGAETVRQYGCRSNCNLDVQRTLQTKSRGLR